MTRCIDCGRSHRLAAPLCAECIVRRQQQGYRLPAGMAEYDYRAERRLIELIVIERRERAEREKAGNPVH